MVAALTVVTAGGASASGADRDARLEALLGAARGGAEVALAARADDLPSAVQRGAPGERSVEDLIAAASPEGDEEWRCLSEAIYHEARGESLEGQVAVAEVVLNRRDSGRYPDSVCGVVEQGTGEKWMCQFSYFCDGLSDAVNDEQAWDRAGRVARVMLDAAPRQLTEGAMFYHTKAVSPYWADEFTQTAEIGAHLFYREDQLQMASNASQ
jgi:spore germination cell wall hydrolase CwlJ-like protein